MALLRSDTGRHLAVPQQALVGRGPACLFRLAHPSVSKLHAVLHRGRAGWTVRDLQSRNGTNLDGAPLEAGVPVPLGLGARLRFGCAPDEWTLVDAGPPAARAIGEDGGVLVGTADLLLLPHPQDPVQIVASAGGWLLDSGPVQTPVEDGAVVQVGGTAWRLSLPVSLADTEDALVIDPRLCEVGLRFAVTRDEEHVEIEVRARGQRIAVLPHRAHSYLLLVLARARVADDGWLYQDDLVDMLQVEQARIYVQMFRARQQLAEVGIRSAAGLFERRRGSGQVRLGVREIEIAQG